MSCPRDNASLIAMPLIGGRPPRASLRLQLSSERLKPRVDIDIDSMGTFRDPFHCTRMGKKVFFFFKPWFLALVATFGVFVRFFFLRSGLLAGLGPTLVRKNCPEGRGKTADGGDHNHTGTRPTRNKKFKKM